LHNNALAALAVQERDTSRYLLFDERQELCGRRVGRNTAPEILRPAEQTHAWAFSGIHVISPKIFPLMTEEGAFSIVDTYLRLVAHGEKIVAFRADKFYWKDLGRPENVAQAEQDLKNKLFL
jgi:NDP-sugar pyrophosphorylase family protein